MLLNTAGGATWVSLHHGGVWASLNTQALWLCVMVQMCTYCSRTDQWPCNRCYASAGYEIAINCAKEQGLHLPRNKKYTEELAVLFAIVKSQQNIVQKIRKPTWNYWSKTDLSRFTSSVPQPDQSDESASSAINASVACVEKIKGVQLTVLTQALAYSRQPSWRFRKVTTFIGSFACSSEALDDAMVRLIILLKANRVVSLVFVVK